MKRTWTSQDSCGNTAEEIRYVEVDDTKPPVITEDSGIKYCLWPPDHCYYCIDRDDFTPVITDDCSHFTWHFVGCMSNQPDDEPGDHDGETVDDCTIATDGSQFCVRAERSELEPGGRSYEVRITATDDCSSTSESVRIGYIHVPLDMETNPADCIFIPHDDRVKKSDPLPFSSY